MSFVFKREMVEVTNCKQKLVAVLNTSNNGQKIPNYDDTLYISTKKPSYKRNTKCTRRKNSYTMLLKDVENYLKGYVLIFYFTTCTSLICFIDRCIISVQSRNNDIQYDI